MAAGRQLESAKHGSIVPGRVRMLGGLGAVGDAHIGAGSALVPVKVAWGPQVVGSGGYNLRQAASSAN